MASGVSPHFEDGQNWCEEKAEMCSEAKVRFLFFKGRLNSADGMYDTCKQKEILKKKSSGYCTLVIFSSRMYVMLNIYIYIYISIRLK